MAKHTQDSKIKLNTKEVVVSIATGTIYREHEGMTQTLSVIPKKVRSHRK